MKPPDSDTYHDIRDMVRRYPRIAKWLESVYNDEIVKLPYAMGVETVHIAQGRCQTLSEILKTLKKARA